METLSKLTPEQLSKADIMERAYDSFHVFVTEIFSCSIDILKDGKFTNGEYVKEICEWYEANRKTVRVSARDHMKSMSIYAIVMWKIYKIFYDKTSLEGHYFSYKKSMAEYHIGKIKTAIESNRWFLGLVDQKSTAQSIISYTWDGVKRFTLHPGGLLEFKRGIHSPFIVIDDPLQDPENKLVPVTIKKINTIMKTQVLDMVQDEIHIVGTAQTEFDFYFDKDFTHRFAVRVDPAVKDEMNKVALWPEWMNYDELMSKKRERGERIFNQEYLCSPSYTEDAFIHKARLMKVINPALTNYTPGKWRKEIERRTEKKEETRNTMVGGWDLGKKNHPSHFVIFEHSGKKRIQRVSKWFDRVDYSEQLEIISEYCDAFEIDELYYDGTRGEMEMQDEQGRLPACMTGVHFGVKNKHSMATAFDLSIERDQIELLNDQRQTGQICIVNNDLQAPETPEGHGDSFWSIGMSFLDETSEDINISFL